MVSLQEKALLKLMFTKDKNNPILKHMLKHVINFDKLSENTISYVYVLYLNDKQIIDRIPTRFIDKNGRWYNDCCYCSISHSKFPNAYCPVFKMDYDRKKLF